MNSTDKRMQRHSSVARKRRGDTPTLSLCMIVRNEEKRLEKCLESIQPYVDEIVVVDTGSADRTMEIARRFGARLFQHPWAHDFSMHRNQSLSYATGDWIVIMDADEVLAPACGDLLRDSIIKAQPETMHVYCHVLDVNRDGSPRSTFSSCRVIRNRMGFHYKGIVHNRLCVWGQAEVAPIQIVHYGYDLSDEEMGAKFKRTVTLLERQLEENPDDMEALFNLTQSYCMKGESEEAIRFGEKLRRLLTDAGFQPRSYFNVYYLLGVSYISMGRIEKAVEISEEGIVLEPSYLDLIFLLVFGSYRLNLKEQAKAWSLRYLKLLDGRSAAPPHPYLIFYKAHSKATVQMILSLILRGEGNHGEAERIAQEVFQQWDLWLKSPSGSVHFPVEAPGLMAEYFLENGKEQDAVDRAGRVLERPFPNRECLWHLIRPFVERKLFVQAAQILNVLASSSPIDLPAIRNLVLEILPSSPFAARLFFRVLQKHERPPELQKLEDAISEKAGRDFLSLCHTPLVISAALMVKDEEELLPACLESIRPCVDEIIVVDTGSRDRTVAIARDYGARVFFHPWENDFSKHRNQSIQYACGDWVFIIDADEEMDRETGKAFRREVEKDDADTIFFLLRSPLSGGSQLSQHASPRLFRNGIGISYEGIVHNQLRYKGRVRHSGIILHHKGYDLKPEAMAQKLKRTQALLERQLRENPRDPFALHNLSVVHLMQGDYASVIKTAGEAISLIESVNLRDVGYMSTFYLLAASHYLRGELENAETWARKGLAYDERNLDAACVLCAVMGKKGDSSAIVESACHYLSLYERLMKEPEEFQGAIFHALGQAGEVALGLGCALWHQGKRDMAHEAFVLAKRIAPERSSITNRITRFLHTHDNPNVKRDSLKTEKPEEREVHAAQGLSLFRKGDMAEAEYDLKKATPSVGPDPTLCMAAARSRLGYGDIDGCVEQLNQVFQEISYPVNGEIQDAPAFIRILHDLGTVLTSRGLQEAASISFQMAHDLSSRCAVSSAL